MAFLLAVFCDVEVGKEVYSLKNVDVNPAINSAYE
jgi:hypothetical protein